MTPCLAEMVPKGGLTEMALLRGHNVCFYEEIWKIIHKLDYQVSICSLIPPATAISKTQDTSVWWKFSFSIYFIIYYVQSTIINKVCKPELWFLYSAHSIIVLNFCMKFHENISHDFSDIERTHVYGGNGHFQYSKGNNS